MSKELFGLLKAQREQLTDLKNSPPWSGDYEVWKSNTSEILKKLFGDQYVKLLDGQKTVVIAVEQTERQKLYLEELQRMEKFLDSCLSESEKIQKIHSARSSSQIGTLRPSSESDAPLLSPEQPAWIGVFVWLFQFPKRLDQYLARHKRLKRPLLRRCLIALLFVLAILLVRAFLISYTPLGDHFGYQPDGLSYGSVSPQQATVIQVWFQADVTNYSSSPRYLANLIDVLWKNEVFGETWDEGFSDAMGTVYVIQGQNRISQTLPILFQPNESKTLAWSFEFTVSDPATMEWLSEQTGEGVFTWPKNEISFLMQDSRGNIYNQYGELQSQPVMDAWWIFPDNRSFYTKTIASLQLAYKIFIWKVREVIPLTG